MRVYRIICRASSAFGTKYYPQVRRWFVWRNILPEHEPACGTLQSARGVIYLCAEVETARKAGNVVEFLGRNRSEWLTMTEKQMRRNHPVDMPAGQPVAAGLPGGWPDPVPPIQGVQDQPVTDPAEIAAWEALQADGPVTQPIHVVYPPEPWPGPPEGPQPVDGVKQPDPYVIVPWPWRWLARYLGDRRAKKMRTQERVGKLLRDSLERRVERLVAQSLARQQLGRFKPSRSRRPETTVPVDNDATLT